MVGLRICCLTLLVLATSGAAAQFEERASLNKVFVEAGVQGTFVLYTPSQNRMILVNQKRAAVRFIPASTFKIANSLIALETGVVEDENVIIPFGGKPQPFKSWEKDMSMRDAIKISNVPIYQELAMRVGRTRYMDWLARLNYGNGKISQNVNTFWLQGPLKISAIEQVKFLAKLAKKFLPLSERSQSIVVNILKLEYSGDKILYGKTGWTNTPDPDIGWFAGWVSDGKTTHAFALNIDIHKRAQANLRISISKKLLQKLGVF